VTLGDLLAGIQITCDQPIDSASISPANVFVVLEVPFPAIWFAEAAEVLKLIAGIQSSISATLDRWTKLLAKPSFLGYQPLILAGRTKVDPNNSNAIDWENSQDHCGLEKFLTSVASLGGPSPCIRAWLILKGDFIWSANDSSMCLDGEAFGTLNNSNFPNNLRLPSGDGRRGGDFQMWFQVDLADWGSSGCLRKTGSSKMAEFISANRAAIIHNFVGSVSKTAFLQQYGAKPLLDGIKVSDALGILSGNPSFASADAIPEALAELESKSLVATLGKGRIFNEAFGTSAVDGTVRGVPIGSLKTVPANIRSPLANAGIPTVGDLANASPTVIRRIVNSLKGQGVTTTIGELARYAGLAKVLVRIQ
jgi:hypothetical protein